MSIVDQGQVSPEDFIAADSGSVSAQIFVGTALLKGDGIGVDRQRGLKYLEAAASKGSKDALFRIAFVKEIEKDISFVTDMKALAKAGYEPALNELGNVYWTGWVVSQNRYRAGVYIRRAARSGNLLAKVRYQQLPLEKPFVDNLSIVARMLIPWKVRLNRVLLAFKIARQRDDGKWKRRHWWRF